jgi:glycosyltransferase involved in cell wall biosynthesis
MKVAVITPYYKEPQDVLTRCYQSVIHQTYDTVDHFMVADGLPTELPVRIKHIQLPKCRDFGDTPRGVASAVAWAQGYDAIAYLDADCWYEPDHLYTMVNVMKESNTDVVTCPRNLYRFDGSFMAVDKESDGQAFNDTNCFLFSRKTFPLLASWMFKPLDLCAIDDRVLWQVLKQAQVKMSRSLKPTVNYTTTLAFHYQQNNEPIPDHAKVLMDKGDGMKVYNWKDAQ